MIKRILVVFGSCKHDVVVVVVVVVLVVSFSGLARVRLCSCIYLWCEVIAERRYCCTFIFRVHVVALLLCVVF